MPKVTVTELENLENEQSAVELINDNFAALAEAFENTYSRDGTSPNTLQANLDANNRRIINLPAPGNDTDPARHGDIVGYVTDAEAAADAADASADAAAASASAAQTSASNAALAEANAETAETNAETAETNAETAAATATTQAGIATTQAGLAATAKTGAETALSDTQAVRTSMIALLDGFASTSSVAIGTGSKSFTVASGLPLGVGMYVLIVSDAAPTTNTMFGQVTSYSGTSLTVNVLVTTGAGTLADWTIYPSGARGATGEAGAGTGDLLASNNLSDLLSATTALTNLGLSANGKSLVTAVDYAAMRSLLGLVIGTNVQAYDADLTTWASLTPSSNAQSLVTASNYAAMRALLDLEAGTDFNSYSAVLEKVKNLSDPNADRIGFWDDSADTFVFFSSTPRLEISGTVLTAAYPKGYLSPGPHIANNVSDATNDIDFSTVACRSEDDTANITATGMTKRLDATYSAGTGNGGRFTSASLSDTTYHCFVISNGTVNDYGFSPNVNPTSDDTYPAGYKYRRVGSIIRASSAIRSFYQEGDRFWLSSQVTDHNSTSAATVQLRTVTAPGGIRVYPIMFNTLVLDVGTTGAILMRTAESSGANMRLNTTGNGILTGFPVPPVFCTNTSSQLIFGTTFFAGSTINECTLVTQGWIDARGQV